MKKKINKKPIVVHSYSEFKRRFLPGLAEESSESYPDLQSPEAKKRKTTLRNLKKSLKAELPH